MSLECCPEWCEQGGDPHDATCPEAAFPLTKAGFVDALESAARHAIESYLWCVRDEGLNNAEALDMALSEVEESAVCYAGIGSCGRGWCNHN